MHNSFMGLFYKNQNDPTKLLLIASVFKNRQNDHEKAQSKNETSKEYLYRSVGEL